MRCCCRLVAAGLGRQIEPLPAAVPAVLVDRDDVDRADQVCSLEDVAAA